MRSFAVRVAVTLAALCAGCAGPGDFVWFHDVARVAPPTATDGAYLIRVGDIVNVRVLGHDEMTTRIRVRSDGRIALPLIGEVDAAGKRPGALRSELEGRLKDYIVQTSVTVNVEEPSPVTVSVLGEVSHPGAFTVEPNTGIATVLALGGGVTEFASRDRIFILRATPKPLRIRFTYDSVSRNEGGAGSFPVRPGDVVVVE
jgi:polysaccharide export outer membrane protein